ncbi:MAG: Mo-dependent nitrogenase C-terminal domain-containing protein [Cyanobacteria bacterium J06623_7]
MTFLTQKPQQQVLNPLRSLRQWLDGVEIEREQTARRIVRLIPAQCPLARDIKLFDRVVLSIPPLCKLNPLYEQLIGLRFRALCFLADRCGEDITPYCS